MNIIYILLAVTVLLPFILFIIAKKNNIKNNGDNVIRMVAKPIDLEQQNYIEEYSRKIKFRSKLFTSSCVGTTLIVPLWFLIYTVLETTALGKELLGIETYRSRMNDSYLFSFVIFALIGLVVCPMILLYRNYLKQYVMVITSLSANDLRKVKLVNEKLSFIDKYMPPCIIRDKTVIFFDIFRGQTIFKFEEINSVIIRKIYGKGKFRDIYTIIALTKKKCLSVRENDFQMEDLINTTLNENPNVKINDTRKGAFKRL